VSEQPHAAHDDGHGHGHASVFIAHHYDDAQHQFDSGKLGIWLFLAQEVLFFSALFVAYVLYRHHHPEIYAYAHKYLDVKMGAINTGILIFSSLTAAWAVRAAQLKQKSLLIGCLAVTIACACGFLVVKYFEYTHKVHEHILFGRYFDPCVSSGGTPLINKGNQCPGTKSTVQWDVTTGAPASGCFADLALDLDPRKRNVQADCEVFAVEGTETTKAGKTEFVEKSRKQITERCFDAVFGPGGGLEGKEPGEANGTAKHGEGHGHGGACWKTNANPHVCKGGFFFTWTCTGEKCAAPSGSEGPFATYTACKEQRQSKDGALKAQGTATLSECTSSGASGILVDFEDHEVRKGNVRIVASCKTPAPPVVPADPLADRVQTLELGQKATTTERPLTHHEEKEALYAGPPPPHTNMFFTIYFAMTGLHGIHVLFGVFVFIWLLIRATKGHFTPDYFGPVDFAALYWHIVDLIWIFLFPLLYLIH
jgi:heme/copper-type cytochrome/quinol oxidase subunit 3